MKKGPSFPFMEEIWELMEDEWEKPERIAKIQNRFTKLYPFNPLDASFWESVPRIDAALQCLARHVSLLLEDSSTFRDLMDRKTDAGLKNIYTVAGAACCPSITLTSISRAVKVWVTNVETALRAGVETAKVIEALEELNLTAAFLAESSIDLVRLLARLMTHAVPTKRALWLRKLDRRCGI